MPKIRLTELALKKLECPKPTDFFDRDYPRLVLRVSPGGTKTWRVLHYVRSPKTQRMIARTVKLGRYPDLGVKEARDKARKFDPKAVAEARAKAEAKATEKTYEDVVTEFIDKYAKPRQRSWKLTEGHLRSVPWNDRLFSSITKTDAYAFLDPVIADGHDAKARVTLAWLRKLWRWAWTRDLVETPVMDAVEIHTESKVRDRVFSDEELKALWNASDGLTDRQSSLTKLLMLLGVRKRELAGMRVSELDDADNPTLWTIPHERTKSRKTAKTKRVYFVPLPPLAVRVLKPHLTGDLVFPGRHHGKPMDPGEPFMRKVRKSSGIEDWSPHAHRHTLATWAENEGASEYERGLLLNHSGSGSVTAGYSHGYPLDLKRQWMERWADHVEAVVQPEGVTLLR